MYIKVYLSETEKNHLREIAEKKRISLSELCYRQLDPLLKSPVHRFLTEDKEAASTEGKNILVHLTAYEYALLLSQSQGMPLSRYFRKILLQQKTPIPIQIYTDDISILTMKVSKYIEQLNNFIAALAIRQQLHEADYERLIQIASDTETALREAGTYARKNRSSIRAAGVRILRKEIQKAVEKWMETYYSIK